MIIFEVEAEIGRIVQCETQYLEKCSLIIEPYIALCAIYGCQINYGLFWRTCSKRFCKQRPSFGKNYECWFGYEITNNGKPVCYDDVEGYTLGNSEGFLFVSKKGSQNNMILEVKYIDDVSDIEDSLEKDYLLLTKMYTKNNSED